MWAGVFGSVSRGTQRSDSDVDIVVGYSPDPDFFVDVCGSMALFLKRLPETLGVEVDVIAFIQRSKTFRYVDMEAILTAKTIWGDVSWPEASRDTAVDLLQQGYARIKKAGEMMSHIRRTLLAIEVLIVKKSNFKRKSLTRVSYQAELMSPGHETLRLSLLQEALSVIHLIKIPGDPFYASLQLTMSEILAKEDTIQACLHDGDVDRQALKGIWVVLSDVTNTASLKGMKQSAEETFRRAGLVSLG